MKLEFFGPATLWIQIFNKSLLQINIIYYDKTITNDNETPPIKS